MQTASSVATTNTSTSTTDPLPSSTIPPVRRPLVAQASTLGHCIVLQVGDSVGNNLGYGLSAQVQGTPGLSLVLRGKASTGLSNSWYYNWPRELTSYLQQFHPHLVIIMLGANDEQSMAVNGHSEPFGSPAWKQAYLDLVLKMDRLATSAGAQVLWVGMPIMGPSGYSDGMKILNSLYIEGAQTVPGVAYLSTWSLFANGLGQYRPNAYVNGSYVGLRHPDGIHFSSPGQSVLGTYVASQLGSIYHVPIYPHAPATITGW